MTAKAGQWITPGVPGRTRALAVAGAVTALTVAVAGCASSGASVNTASSTKVINAIGAENEYASVLSQIGGKYVHVSSVLDNPSTDPHTFESSPRVASEVSAATLIVQNGVGYDSWINKIESASPNPRRRVIVAQQVLGLPDSTPNPHLWYDPKTMPAVAKVMAADMSALQPAHKAYFQANLARFKTSMAPWLTAIAQFKAKYPGAPVAVTEPVSDYLLQAMGMDIRTPFSFQADIMNGVDPSPQGISGQNGLFTQHKVKVFCYNQQVVSALTRTFQRTAGKAGVPVVAVYETMPTPGFTYQTWMLAEVHAIEKAITGKTSTPQL
ncbi:MAG: zinc ABC transporter substrate-binding protein [Actinobacteria bacterium]|nr:zinc ABC transporter substrate-binding protein [Actinomycetota bacterium]